MSDWRNMDQWEMVLPPSRPTVEELNRIERYIDGYSRSEPIAILGKHHLNFVIYYTEWVFKDVLFLIKA